MALWVENPTMQYFTGSQYREHKAPFDPSDLVHCRDRMGKEGVEEIFASAVRLHAQEVKKPKMVLSDTMVLGNHVTFPTDVKWAKKGLDICNRIAKKENIQQRQMDAKASTSLMMDTPNGKHPQRAQKATKATSKRKIVAGRPLGNWNGKGVPNNEPHNDALKKVRSSHFFPR